MLNIFLGTGQSPAPSKELSGPSVKSVKAEELYNKRRRQNDKKHINQEFQNVNPEVGSAFSLLWSICTVLI